MENLFNFTELTTAQAYLFGVIGFLIYWSLKLRKARTKVSRTESRWNTSTFMLDHLLAILISLLGCFIVVYTAIHFGAPPSIWFLLTATVTGSTVINSIIKIAE